MVKNIPVLNIMLMKILILRTIIKDIGDKELVEPTSDTNLSEIEVLQWGLVELKN